MRVKEEGVLGLEGGFGFFVFPFFSIFDSVPYCLGFLFLSPWSNYDYLSHTMSDPYGRLLSRMLPFHANFRHHYAQILKELPKTKTGSEQQVNELMMSNLQLCSHLEMHHSIEEAYIFPQLARRIPEFGKSSQHTREHEAMHAGLAILQNYSEQVIDRLEKEVVPQKNDGKPWPKEMYDVEKMESILHHLGQVLFPHLDAEENSISADSMRKAGFTIEELHRIPI